MLQSPRGVGGWKTHPSRNRVHIESLRHPKFKIPREQRICSLCSNEVEDEPQFLFACRKPEDQHRFFDNIVNAIGVKHWNKLSNVNKLLIIFSNGNLTVRRILAKSVHSTLTQRKNIQALLLPDCMFIRKMLQSEWLDYGTWTIKTFPYRRSGPFIQHLFTVKTYVFRETGK